MIARRAWMAAAAVLAGGMLPGCGRDRPAALWPSRWVGAHAARGHRLRDAPGAPASAAAAPVRRAGVVVVGGGIAGLAALHRLAREGIDDAVLLELEDDLGGNSRGHRIEGIACPLGAHYLPLPGEPAREVAEWLESIGLLRRQGGRLVADERHLCHAPQERLFIDGAWQEGLLPHAEPGSAAWNEARRFSDEVAAAQRTLGFAIPTLRARWTAAHAALDAIPFSAWLDRRGIHDPGLRWTLDYCCRDDYGAGADVVSAWAGLHYFASRHGFRTPGDDTSPAEDPVLTWPEGNAWLVQRLAAPLAGRCHTGRVVQRIEPGLHAVQLDAWDATRGQSERWIARQVVLAVPLFIAARLLPAPPPALAAALQTQRMAPWLVANLQIDEPLVDRLGLPLAWDNVIHGAEGLGYVNAMHQALSPAPGPTVFTAYAAVPEAERAALLAMPAEAAAARIVAPLAAVHPDLPRKIRRADLMRYGHAMAIPVPGARGSAARAALADAQGRLHFGHADLSAYSVFEEAYTRGWLAGGAAADAVREPRLAVRTSRE